MKLGQLQTRWVEALESGNFPQGTGALLSENGFCCLGVADYVCDLNEPESANLFNSYDKIGLRTSRGDVLEKDQQTISDFFKLPSHEGHCLTFANDRGATFAQIAAFIRKYPELIFTEEK